MSEEKKQEQLKVVENTNNSIEIEPKPKDNPTTTTATTGVNDEKKEEVVITTGKDNNNSNNPEQPKPPIRANELTKCSTANCNKFYHLTCI